MITADLHVHSWHSIDSDMLYDQLIKACQQKGINCIALSDHGTTRGARELVKIAPFKVIVCEEVLTPFGEIMGMFLEKDIPNKISVEETISLIREQQGLVCIPHPFDIVRPSAFRDMNKLQSIMDEVDIIEVFNARSLYPGSNGKAKWLAQKYNKVMSAGTDAHSHLEIGGVRVEMQDFETATEFLNSLSVAKISGTRSSPLIHILSTAARMKKRCKREKHC